MKLSFSMVTYGSCVSWIPAYSLEESVKRLHEIGYCQAEVTTASPHAWPYYLGEKRRREIKECLEKYEMKFSAVVPYIGGGPGCNLASTDLEERKWTIQYFKDVVDLAVSFSASLVPCMAGWVLFGKDRKEAWDNSREGLKEVAAYAREQGVKIALIPSETPSGIVDLPEDVWRMKKEIDLPNLTLGFDVTSAWNRIQDPEDYIYLFGKELGYLGICDFGGKVPGLGTADFLCWKKALDKVGFQGTVTVKLSSERSVCADSAARKSLEFLKDWEDAKVW